MKNSFDWRDVSVTRTQSMRHLDQFSWAPRPLVNFRALGWSLVVLLFVGFLVGLMAVGS